MEAFNFPPLTSSLCARGTVNSKYNIHSGEQKLCIVMNR